MQEDDKKQNDSLNTEEEISGYKAINFAENFAQRFISAYSKISEHNQKNNFYNPFWANSALKMFDTNSIRPTMDNLIRWINNPENSEKELRAVSYFLNESCMYYQRTIHYLSNILNFDYVLIPIKYPSINASKKEKDLFQKQQFKSNEWLRKFRVKEQLNKVTREVITTGGKYYFLRTSEDNNYLQRMPEDYCYITGFNSNVGYTYQLDMTFFYQFPESMSGFAPEFADWYEEFLFNKNYIGKNASPYRLMPIESSVVFKFDDNNPQMVPPLSGIFKSALDVENYQDLLKLKMEIDTIGLLYLQTPSDDQNKPTITAQESANYLAAVQSLLPTGYAAVTAPHKLEQVKVNNSANMDNIIGKGGENYWQDAGIASSLFSDSKSAVGIQNSIKADYLYVEHLYNQYERFLNYHLSLLDGTYKFMIKFLRRSNYELESHEKTALQKIPMGFQLDEAMATFGYEPYQMDASLVLNILNGYSDKLRPPQTSFTMTGDNGRPKAEDVGKQISDSNDITRNAGSNVGKMSNNIFSCLNCNKEIEEGSFCNESCKVEYCIGVLGEFKD